MILVLRRLHEYYYRFTAIVSLLLFYPAIYYCSLKPQRFATLNKIRRLCCFLSSTASGIFYKFEYQKPIDWSRTYIICPNHTSNLDILSMSLMIKNNFCFIGKQELMNNPLTGIFLRSVDIPVDRASKRSSFKAYQKMTENLKKGISLIVFPEGGISDVYPPVLQEFKNGPFRLAIDLKIPIIPVTSLNTWQILWDSGTKYGSRPGICNIYLHAPIETARLLSSDADGLRDKVYDIIYKKFNNHDHR